MRMEMLPFITVQWKLDEVFTRFGKLSVREELYMSVTFI